MSEITPVAYIYTDFSSKFGIPRQSGLTDNIAKIVFEPDFRNPDAVRGLDKFSHIWLIWEFSENRDRQHSLTVRPPRLGGNIRMGVFATRSPFRPNNLGLSCVKLEKICYDCEAAPVIYVRGADILNGTPIFDIKPYIPFSDCIPGAEGGFSDGVRDNNLTVVLPQSAANVVREEDIAVIKEILSQDPRPHYHTDPERVYAFEYSSYRIKFTVRDNILTVKEITDY